MPGPTAADLARFHAALSVRTARQGRFERLLRGAFRGWCRFVAWRVLVDIGDLPRRDGVPGAGCLVAAAPHRAWLEPFLLLAAWPADAARLVWLADGRTVIRSRWRRWLLPRVGVIPIEGRSAGPRTYAQLAASACERGLAVVVFPEVGPPSPPDRPRRISPGFAYLALGAGAPVVPVVVGGTHHIVRGASFSVDLLEPLAAGVTMADPFTGEGRRHAAALAGELEGRISTMLPARNAELAKLAPARDRWRWLSGLLR